MILCKKSVMVMDHIPPKSVYVMTKMAPITIPVSVEMGKSKCKVMPKATSWAEIQPKYEGIITIADSFSEIAPNLILK